METYAVFETSTEKELRRKIYRVPSLREINILNGRIYTGKKQINKRYECEISNFDILSIYLVPESGEAVHVAIARRNENRKWSDLTLLIFRDYGFEKKLEIIDDVIS